MNEGNLVLPLKGMQTIYQVASMMNGSSYSEVIMLVVDFIY